MDATQFNTNMLAGTLWCMRVLILEFTLPLNQQDKLGKDKPLNPMDRVKKVRDQRLVEESECPFATLHSLMNYGFVVAKQSVGEWKVRWSEDKQTMLFRGHMVNIDDWKQFILDLLETIERMLAQQLMFKRDRRLPDENLWGVVDDRRREEAGYYFGALTQEQWDKARKLWSRIIISCRRCRG
jgi:hypothetical protein